MLWRLVYNRILNNKLKTILVLLTFSISIFFTIFIFFFYNNVENFFIKKWIWDVNFKKFDIYLKSSVSSISLNNSGFNDSNLKKLDELKTDPNIDKLYYFYNTKLPFSIKIDVFWNTIDTDVFLFAVSDNFFKDHNITNFSWNVLNFAISQSLIEFYNLQLANWDYFPRVPQDLFYTINFDSYFGKSVFLKFSVNDYVRKWKISIIDNVLPVVWLTLPYSNAKQIFEKLWRDDIMLNRIVWYAKQESYVWEIEKKFSDFNVSSDQKVISKIQNKLVWLKLFLIGLNIAVLILLMNFLVYIVYSILESNKNIFHVFRTHGASKFKILQIILIEILYYILPVVVFVIVVNYIFSKWLLLFISNWINNNYYINYLMIPMSFTEICLLLSIFILLIVALTVFSTINEWNREFENR